MRGERNKCELHTIPLSQKEILQNGKKREKKSRIDRYQTKQKVDGQAINTLSNNFHPQVFTRMYTTHYIKEKNKQNPVQSH